MAKFAPPKQKPRDLLFGRTFAKQIHIWFGRKSVRTVKRGARLEGGRKGRGILSIFEILEGALNKMGESSIVWMPYPVLRGMMK